MLISCNTDTTHTLSLEELSSVADQQLNWLYVLMEKFTEVNSSRKTYINLNSLIVGSLHVPASPEDSLYEAHFDLTSSQF